jgi:hypothetical protein
MQKWEYLFLHIVGQQYAINGGDFTVFSEDESILTVTHDLEKKGWELMLKDYESTHQASGTWVFKRPLKGWVSEMNNFLKIMLYS